MSDISDVLAVGRYLGLNKTGAERANDITTLLAKQQGMELAQEKFALDIEKEKFDRVYKGAHLTYGMMEKALSNPALSEVHREWLLDMAEQYGATLPPEMQAGFKVLPGLRFLSDEGQREREFDRRFKRPEDPRGADGLALPLTPENEHIHAKTRFAQMEYDYKKAITIFGVDKGKEMVKIPKLIQVSTPGSQGSKASVTSEGKTKSVETPATEAQTGQNLWFLDPDTRQVTSINPGVLGVDLTQAEKWGYNLRQIAMTGGAPIGEPSFGEYNGKKFRVTPMKDLLTGKEFVDRQDYGETDAGLKGIPEDVVTAFSYVKLGIKEAGTLAKGGGGNPNALAIAKSLMKLEDSYSRFKGKEASTIALDAQLAGIDRQIKSMYPQMQKYQLVRLDKELPTGYFGGFSIEDVNFGFIKADRQVRVKDANGAPVVLHQDSETGNTFDAKGRKIDTPTPPKDGDTVSEIILKPTEQPKKVGQATQVPEAAPEFVIAGLGKAVSSLVEGLGLFGQKIGQAARAVGSLDVSGEFSPEKVEEHQKKTTEINEAAKAELNKTIENVRSIIQDARTEKQVAEVLNDNVAYIIEYLRQLREKAKGDKTAVETLDEFINKLLGVRSGE